jgi:hypothetical protein
MQPNKPLDRSRGFSTGGHGLFVFLSHVYREASWLIKVIWEETHESGCMHKIRTSGSS